MDNSASNRRLAVSTECPTCSAPLDFSEGSNAIRCGHCRSNLLVTGRGQILSYAIEPRTPEGQARNHLRSLFREPGARVSEPKLFFVPFYRVTGHEFVWRKEAPKPKVERSLSELSGDTSRELEWGGWGGGGGYERFTLAGLIVDGVSALIDRLTSVGEPVGLPELEKRETSKAQPLPPPVSPRGEPIEFSHRHIEKNFVASESEGLGIYSLGVRSAVLKLALFDAAALAQIGSLLPVMLDPATATERGLMGGDKDVLVRRTAGVIVSLIYFPFWLAKIDGAKGERLVALDGVTGGIASREVSPSLLASAGSGSGTAAVVAGFRPLVCPNCGWDLNVSPDDVIFFCRTCRRAWKIEKDTLMPASYEIASIAHVTVGEDDLYLPFWIADSPGEPEKIWVPAFRYRQLRHLEMLGSRLSRMKPEYSSTEEPLASVHGVHYDERDGVALAEFLLAGLVPGGSGAVGRLTLLWVPLDSRGHFLFDPFIGSNLYANLLY